MMSKNSFCRTKKMHSSRSTLDIAAQMRENGKRRLWLFALFCFVMLLCYPLMTALVLNRYAGNNMSDFLMRQGIGHSMLGLTGGSTVFLLTVGAVFCAVEGFYWIYSRKKIDMYLSQPITLGRRFLMAYINGILIYFVPYIISLLLALLVISGAGAASGALFVNLLFTVPSALIYFLAVYNLTIAAMMISGKRGMGFCILIVFLYDLFLRATLESYCSAYFSTYADRGEAKQFISPVCRMVVMLDNSLLTWGSEAITAGEVVEKLVRPLLPDVFVLLVEAVVFGAAAYACYKKRPMEAVSQAVAFETIKGPVKVLLMVLAGLLCSICFCDISGNSGFFVAFSGLLLGIVFCQVLLEIVYEGDLKAFLRHKKFFAAGAVATVSVYLFFALDVSGYDTWVPGQEDVESAAIEIYFGNRYCYNYVDEKGAEAWSDRYGIDMMEVTDVSGILSLAKDGMGKDAREQNPDTRLNCEVKYKMKNGKEKYRNFFIDYEQEKTVLDILFANEEYKEGINQVLSEQMDWIFERSRACYSNGLQEKEILDKNALALMRAYRHDLREMSFSDVKDAVPCGILLLSYRTDDLEEHVLEYPVFPSYLETIKYLRGKDIELYPNINPMAVESIVFSLYTEEDPEIVEKGSFFGRTVTSLQEEKVTGKEYTKEEQIREILEYIYPASLMRWVYIPDCIDQNIAVDIQEADNQEAYKYSWNDTFMVKKGELPEFVKEDMGADK